MAARTGDHPEYNTSLVNAFDAATHTSHGSNAIKAQRIQGEIHQNPASTFAEKVAMSL